MTVAMQMSSAEGMRTSLCHASSLAPTQGQGAAQMAHAAGIFIPPGNQPSATGDVDDRDDRFA